MKKLLSLLLIAVLLAAVALPAFAEQGLDDGNTLRGGTEKAATALAAEASGFPEVRITLADGLTLETVNAGSKDTKYPGNKVSFIGADGKSKSCENVELKGRGNFTWNHAGMDKKPYQLKLDSKEKVFGMDKAKKWVLLANHADATLMRNRLAFDLAKAIGMPYTPEGVWVDVYVNDEYIGNYLICEKNEVGSNRVPLEDEYGVLCEIDGNYGTSEDVYYKTAKEKTVVVLSDSVADDVGEKNSVSEAAFKAFCDKLDKFEALLYDSKATWSQIEELIDVGSFINYYFIQELTEDPDGCRSSFYMWSDGKDDVIHLGPVWDYDSAMGAYAATSLGGDPKVDYSIYIEKYMGSSSVGWFRQLFDFSEFDGLAVERYNSVISPVFNTIPSMIESYLTDAFAASAARNFEKWDGILGNGSIFGSNGHSYADTYAGEVEYLRTWLQQRVSYLDSRYASSPVMEAHEHTDSDRNGLCDECGYRIRSTFSATLERIMRAIDPLGILSKLLNSTRNAFFKIMPC